MREEILRSLEEFLIEVRRGKYDDSSLSDILLHIDGAYGVFAHFQNVEYGNEEFVRLVRRMFMYGNMRAKNLEEMSKLKNSERFYAELSAALLTIVYEHFEKVEF